MELSVRKLMPHFAAEVEGIDLRQPVPDAVLAELRHVIADNGVVVLPGQKIDDEQQLAFTALFGNPEASHAKSNYVTVRPDVVIVSNVDPVTNEILPLKDKRTIYRDANLYWHSDSSFKKVPVSLSLLSAREVPPAGADTEFADMRIVWDELPESTQKVLEAHQGAHSVLHSKRLAASADALDEIFSEEERRKNAPVLHPLVIRHPVNGRKAVYVGSHTSHIAGMPEDEGRALIEDLLKSATKPSRIYSHRWRPNDLVIWDNQSVVHRARPFESQQYRRVLHRTMVSGNGPLIAA